MVDHDTAKRGRGRPKKSTSMTGSLAFRCPQDLVDWLEAEGAKRALGVGDVARMFLMEKMHESKGKR